MRARRMNWGSIPGRVGPKKSQGGAEGCECEDRCDVESLEKHFPSLYRVRGA